MVFMHVNKTECVCARVSTRPAKGCYGLSGLVLARLPCARRYMTNCKPIRQMANSSSSAPWVGPFSQTKWVKVKVRSD